MIESEAGQSDGQANKEQKISPIPGVRAESYAFLLAAIKYQAYEGLDIRRRNLIGIYFGTAASLQDLVPQAEVTTRERVRQLVTSGMERLLENLPEEAQLQFQKESIIKLKKGRTHSEDTRAKMSEAHKGRWQDPNYRAKMSEAHRRRRAKPD